MKKSSPREKPGPSSVKHGRGHLPRMKRKEAALIGRWLLEANNIPKHLQSQEMEAFIREAQQRFYELALDALDTLQYELQVRKNGWLGYQFLVDMGVVPCAGEAPKPLPAPSPSQKDTELADEVSGRRPHGAGSKNRRREKSVQQLAENPVQAMKARTFAPAPSEPIVDTDKTPGRSPEPIPSEVLCKTTFSS
jgi:hypothetical protein